MGRVIPSGQNKDEIVLGASIRWAVGAYGVAMLAVCVLIILVRCFTAIQDFDGSFNATLAKNLAANGEYVTTYQPYQGYTHAIGEDPKRWFNAEITTGVGLTLPSVPFFLAFGSQYWTPSIAAFAVNAVLLGALCWFALRRAARPDIAPTLVYFLAVLLAVATTDVFWPGEAMSILRPWYEYVGEAPAALYVVLGASLAFVFWEKWQVVAVGGLLFGLGIQTKSLAAIQVLVLVPLFAGYLLCRATIVGAIWRSALLAACVMVPSALVGLWMRLATPSQEQLAEHAIATRLLFQGAGSGLQQLKDAPEPISYMLANLPMHAKVLGTAFGPLEMVCAASLVGLAIFLGVRELLESGFGRKRPIDPWVAVALALVIAGLGQYAWWFLLEWQGWLRRITQANIILAVGVALIFAFSAGRTLRLGAIALTLLISLPAAAELVGATGKLREGDPRLKSALVVAPFLERKEAEGYAVMGCGFSGNRELELMQPGEYNFVDCLRIPPRAWGKPALLVRGPHFNLLMGRDEHALGIVKACERDTLIDAPPFVVSECPSGILPENYLWVGYNPPERGGRWAERHSIIPLAAVAPKGPLTLVLEARNPDLVERPLTGVLLVQRGDQTVWSKSLELTGAVPKLNLQIPAEIAASADRVRIDVDREFVPAELGMGPDTRRLGVFVSINPDYDWNGFYEPEGESRWTGKRGVFAVTPQMLERGLKLALLAANPDLRARPLLVRVRLRAGEQVVAEKILKLVKAVTAEEWIISTELLRVADNVEIVPARTMVPAEVGAGPDLRELGVLVVATGQEDE